MSDYQQPQAGWEWRRDQEDELWYAENIENLATQEELAACQPIIDNMLAQFDSIFGQEIN